MRGAADFTLGSKVVCSDGVCGDLKRVILDPKTNALTHLVVTPRHRRGTGRLVPLDLVAATVGDIELRCTRSEYQALESSVETEFLPAPAADGAYGAGNVFLGGGGLRFDLTPSGSPKVVRDRIPVGEVAVRGGQPVHATDGEIGRVRELVIDPRDGHVTHILLDAGHLWGERTIAVPISAVDSVADGVRLKITKDEVRDLSPAEGASPG